MDIGAGRVSVRRSKFKVVIVFVYNILASMLTDSKLRNFQLFLHYSCAVHSNTNTSHTVLLQKIEMARLLLFANKMS
jgi:hypothetical protein